MLRKEESLQRERERGREGGVRTPQRARDDDDDERRRLTEASSSSSFSC